MNILITGINGFVGTNLTENWEGHHVLLLKIHLLQFGESGS
jgi:nucleoside-diphosphate-sugar epimerase